MTLRIMFIGLLALTVSGLLAKMQFSERSVHCLDCPSETCLCIETIDGEWVLSPEVGDAEEE